MIRNAVAIIFQCVLFVVVSTASFAQSPVTSNADAKTPTIVGATIQPAPKTSAVQTPAKAPITIHKPVTVQTTPSTPVLKSPAKAPIVKTTTKRVTVRTTTKSPTVVSASKAPVAKTTTKRVTVKTTTKTPTIKTTAKAPIAKKTTKHVTIKTTTRTHTVRTIAKAPIAKKPLKRVTVKTTTKTSSIKTAKRLIPPTPGKNLVVKTSTVKTITRSSTVKRAFIRTPNYKESVDIATKIANIEAKANAILGITAIHIESNQVVSHNGEMPFFMASTAKLPIAITFLHQVDENHDSLDRVINLNTSNSVPGSGSLHYIFEKKDLNMSLKQILKHMLINSDNSASDTVLHQVSGPTQVTKRMKMLGFNSIVLNRSILETLLDTNAVNHGLLRQAHTVYSWNKAFNSMPLDVKVKAWERFQNDRRDSTTPNDMAQLLVKLNNNDALSEPCTKLLLQIMSECRTGRSRIKGLLPASAKVAHKTGTWTIDEPYYINYKGSKELYRFASDVGIITLPNNKGHIAIAIYVKSKSPSDYPRTHAIALASRAVYDHFVH